VKVTKDAGFTVAVTLAGFGDAAEGKGVDVAAK